MKIQFSFILIAGLFLFSANKSRGDDSVNQAASTAQNQNAAASQAASQIGQNLAQNATQQYSKCTPTNPSPCKLGDLLSGLSLLSMLQSGANGATAGQAAGTATDTAATGTTAAQTLTAASSGSSIGGSLAMSQLSKGINGNSVNYAKGTVTDATGATYKAADFSSAASMAAKGFSPDQIATALAAASAAEKDALGKIKLGALTPTSGIDEGGGGGGGSAPPMNDDSSAAARGGTIKSAKAEEPPLDTTPHSFNGDPVGGSAEDLFKMMSRRYHFKDQQNAFIDEHDLLYMKK